jgi:hypothetical protein
MGINQEDAGQGITDHINDISIAEDFEKKIHREQSQ